MSMTPTHAEIFGAPTCPYCDKAKALLTERGIPFTYHDVDASEDAFDSLFALVGTWKTVPQIFVNGEHVGGFDDLKEMLG